MHFDPMAFFSGASFLTVITIGLKLWGVLARIEKRLLEHDMMWFDYCEKHNIMLSPTARRFNGSYKAPN